jgi:hypothetical protein
MIKKLKVSPLEKEELIKKKIEKAKKQLVSLRQKRKAEIGKMACKFGLDAFDNKTLERAFKKLVSELGHGKIK